MGTRAAAIVAVVAVTGCRGYGSEAFSCTQDGQCGAGGACERPTGFCSTVDNACPSGRKYTDHSGGLSGVCVGEEPIDAGNPADTSPDARVCFGTAPYTICLRTAPTTPLTLSGDIDTASSQMCAATTSGGGNYCVIAATMISVDAVTRAFGPKPLVLLASDSISITAPGLVDVGSHRGLTHEIGAGAEPVTCVDGTLPGTANGTNAGGAGGSFGGTGGNGGAGGKGGAGGVPGAVVTGLTTLRGGCAGQDGRGPGGSKGTMGHGGGAVLLIAGSSIDMNGMINAAGEGGTGAANSDSGGGGGGSGGMIVLDAPTLTVSGLILANGGGGGGGSGTTSPGAGGSDSTAITAASGGGGGGPGGSGGNGSAGASGGTGGAGASGNGTGSGGGGGGGGGGAGVVKAPAGANLGANVSPLPTP